MRVPTLPAACVRVPAALLLLASCGWKSDGEARLEGLYPTPPPRDAAACPLPDDPAAAATPVGGSCTRLAKGARAARIVQFGTINPMNLGPWNLRIVDSFVAVPVADGSSFHMTFCGQDTSLTDADDRPIAMGATHMPDATRDAIAAHDVVLPIVEGASFGRVAWIWGAKDLADPFGDPLPTEAEPAHEWDEDADGHPGVTVGVLVPQGDRYMARRSTWTFRTPAISLDSAWVTGTVQPFAVEEHALGASTDALKTVAPIVPRDKCGALVQMRCVRDSYSCADLRRDAAWLFRDAPQ